MREKAEVGEPTVFVSADQDIANDADTLALTLLGSQPIFPAQLKTRLRAALPPR